MVAGNSPEWLPSGFTVKTKYRYGKKIQYYFNVATGENYYSKKAVINCATEDKSLLFTPEEKKGDDNGPSSINEVDAALDTRIDSAAWLPNGWKEGERMRKTGAQQGTSYKVYTHLASGKSFYSKAAVTRYLNTMDPADTMNNQNKCDNLVEPLPDTMLQVLPMTNSGSIHEKKRKGDSLVKSDNVVEPLQDLSGQVLPMPNTGSIPEKKRQSNSLAKIDTVVEPFPDISPQVKSTTKTDGNCEKKRKRSSFVMVSIERTTDDDLPSGWTKDIRTSKSGDKFRKDPFYTDPVSGYMFRSKPDVLRYLETNDIRSCRIKPLKRELDEVKLIENEIPSSDPANEKLSMPNKQLFLDEESNGGGESSANINVKMGNNPELESDLSKKDGRVLAIDVSISSPVNDPSTKQQIPDSGVRNMPGSRKSKKRGGSSVPLRTSKRLAGSEPEIQCTLDLRDCTPRAAVKVITASEVDACPSFSLKASDSIPQASNIEPAEEATDHAVNGESLAKEAADHTVIGESSSKEATDHAVVGESSAKEATDHAVIGERSATEAADRTVIGESSAKEVADHAVIGESSAKEAADHAVIGESSAKEAADHAVIGEKTHQNVDQLKEVEKPPTESSVIPEEPSGEKTSEKPLHDGQIFQESQLCYDFGDSWSDPLEFAFKTLRGEIPIEDTLSFPSCFGEKLDTRANQVDGSLNQSQFAAPINLQGEFASHSESSKMHNAVDPLPASLPLFSPLQNSVNPLPASSSSFSAVGNIGLSSFGSFNYQPSTEVGKEDSKTKYNP